ERLLHGVEIVALGDALDRGHRPTVGVHAEIGARAHRKTLHQDGAGATDLVLAADLRPGQAKLGAHQFRQRSARFDSGLADRPVDDGSDGVCAHVSCLVASLRHRLMVTAVRCTLYSSLPPRSAITSRPSAIARASISSSLSSSKISGLIPTAPITSRQPCSVAASATPTTGRSEKTTLR